MLWSIFAYLFCASATNGCYFMEIDGYLVAQEPFTIVSRAVLAIITPELESTIPDTKKLQTDSSYLGAAQQRWIKHHWPFWLSATGISR